MHEIGSETTLDIPMTDGNLETAVRIRAWLDVITGKGLKINDNFPFLSQSVIQLARKYECPGVESSTIAFVHRAMEILPMEKTFQLLRVGAAIDDPEIVAKAIRVLGDVHWGEEIPPLPADQIPGVPETWMTDPSTWSWAHYKDLPLEYLWAMSRSSRMGGTKEDRGIKMMELIEEIKCESSSQCEMTTNPFTVSDAEKRKAERDLAMEQ